eukprot:3434999-Pyramimonas_sp.AAC.1
MDSRGEFMIRGVYSTWGGDELVAPHEPLPVHRQQVRAVLVDGRGAHRRRHPPGLHECTTRG